MQRNTVQSIVARLVKREPTTLPTGCWEWPGRRCSGDYGQVSLAGKLVMIHRVVWEHFRGPIPEGLEIDHQCRNRICANPDHLEAVPPLKNRGVYHPYTPAPRIDPPPFRVCPHGGDLVTLCPSCRDEYRLMVNDRARAKDARQTHCSKGHPLVDAGTRKNGWKHRYCPLCLSTGGRKRSK